MRRNLYPWVFFGLTTFLGGCATDAPQKETNSTQLSPPKENSSTTEGTSKKEVTSQKPALQRKEISENNEGYALLYSLMKDESDVSKIFIIKHVSSDANSAIKEVAAFAKDTRKQLDGLAKADHSLSFEKTGLPKIEQESRDSTKKADTKSLLGSSGSEFERRLVFLQVQAMEYANELANALKPHETDAARKKLLEEVEAKSASLADRLLKLLEVKPETK